MRAQGLGGDSTESGRASGHPEDSGLKAASGGRRVTHASYSYSATVCRVDE